MRPDRTPLPPDTFLLSNMEALGVDPARTDDIVISHKHMDQTGGLDTLVEMKVGKNACLVKSITMGLRGKLAAYGATLTEIDEPAVIAKGALSTGANARRIFAAGFGAHYLDCGSGRVMTASDLA